RLSAGVVFRRGRPAPEGQPTLLATTTVERPFIGKQRSRKRKSGVNRLKIFNCQAVIERCRKRVLPIHHAMTPALLKKNCFWILKPEASIFSSNSPLR